MMSFRPSSSRSAIARVCNCENCTDFEPDLVRGRIFLRRLNVFCAVFFFVSAGGDHLGPFELQHNLGGLWHFWCGAWILFARMERAGTTTIDTAIPRLGDGPFEVACLSQHFRRRLTDLGERLDRRNGND